MSRPCPYHRKPRQKPYGSVRSLGWICPCDAHYGPPNPIKKSARREGKKEILKQIKDKNEA
jgi:hypothetical protein